MRSHTPLGQRYGQGGWSSRIEPRASSKTHKASTQAEKDHVKAMREAHPDWSWTDLQRNHFKIFGIDRSTNSMRKWSE